MERSIAYLLVLVSIFTCVLSDAFGIDDQVNPNVHYGTFATPSSNVRPRFRYWVPDASVNLSQLSFDIADAGSKGVGGVEILGYYLYGDLGYGGENAAQVPTDWTTYGWGTQAWRDIQDTALQATKDNGLIVDFTLGPNQGAGIPTPVDDNGLLWDLASFNITMTNGSFQGVLPGWGTGPFISASVGLVTSTVNETVINYYYRSPETDYALVSTLDNSTLQDLTPQVGSDGSVEFTAPTSSQTGNWTLFAYYLVHSEFRECVSPSDVNTTAPQSPITDYVQNGSWVVDHFSTDGAQLIVDFWEDHLLNGSTTKDLLAEVGSYLWEDSQEFNQAVYIFWTPELQNVFLANRSYSINKYIPLLFHSQTQLQTQPWYVTDEPDGGASHVTDYRQTLTELNAMYLSTLTEWANSLGVQFSAQVAYNLPMDMLENMPLVNGPEIETLGFNHVIDWYRQAAGAIHLAGKRILSTECGAFRNQAYFQTIPDLLWDVKRSIAGTVNNFILHGMPYSGDYPNTTWPTFTTFNYDYSQMYGRHEPAWDFYSDFINYMSRMQYVGQTGVPQIDLAFYLKDDNFQYFITPYGSNDLQEAGFTYHYLGPQNFELPNAYVLDGVLDPDGQSFKALVVQGNASMTVLGAQKINEYARSGLPVIFSGGIPSNISGYEPSASGYINMTLNEIASLPNVHQVGFDSLAQAMASLGITPRVSVSANSTWYPTWRKNASSGSDYISLYNDATGPPIGSGYSVGNVTFEASTTPYFYDAWTGSTTPVPVYSKAGNTTTIPLQLAGNQTVLIAFLNTSAPAPYLNSTTYQYPSSGNETNTSIFVTSLDLTPLLASNNTFSSPPSPTILGPWNLTIESWTQPADTFDIATTAIKTNTTYPLPSIVPWPSISASLKTVSGRGSFPFPRPHFHTARASVNGAQLPPLDVTDAIADIGPYLTNGENTVEIVVATPLGNALIPVWGELLTSGRAPDMGPPPVREYGLVSDVTVVPYVEVEL